MKRTALPTSFLRSRNYLYVQLAAALATLAIAAYALDPSGTHRGSSFVGYVLGGVAAGSMVWLAWFGVRKRRYGAWRVPLADWLSAHTYLGLIVPLLAGLHCGFKVGWNVHGLAYVLTCLAVVSGVVGVLVYAAVPIAMRRDHPDERLRDLLLQLNAVDQECDILARRENLPDAFFERVHVALNGARTTSRPAYWFRKAAAADGCRNAIAAIEKAAAAEPREPRDATDRILAKLKWKEGLLDRLRKELRHRTLLEVWLVLHVPLAIAALVAVAIHIFVVLAI